MDTLAEMGRRSERERGNMRSDKGAILNSRRNLKVANTRDAISDSIFDWFFLRVFQGSLISRDSILRSRIFAAHIFPS